MNKLYTIAACLVLGFAFVGFQNCSKDASFDIGNSAGVSGLGTEDGGIESGPSAGVLTVDNNQANIHGRIIEVLGDCDGNGDQVTIDGSGISNTLGSCDSAKQRYAICTIATELGESTVNVSQVNSENSSQNISVPISITSQFSTQHFLHVQNVLIKQMMIGSVEKTVAEITIGCEPGSNISAEIYGAQQVARNGQEGETCYETTTETQEMGTFKFFAVLVASAGSAQRVVTIKQTPESGAESSVFVDVDNTNLDVVHECSVAEWSASANICGGHAGSIAGSCRGGIPVQIFVNGALQQTVSCTENDGFIADNILLTDASIDANSIEVRQESAFGTSCVGDYGGPF